MEKRLSPGIKTVRIIFCVLAILFGICVLIQVFLAGLAIFYGPDNWSRHTSFIHLFEYLPILMFILSFFGRIKGAARWLSFGLILLIMVQYATVKGLPEVGYLAALHPVVALLIFWAAIVVIRRSLRLF
ncbi:MAG TPA: DUF6220 domain-containing protein [Bacilli bacterium]